MKPGTIVTDIEGLDLGPDGAVVIAVDGDEVELARLDTKEIVTVDIGKADYAAEDAEQGTGIDPRQYDESAMEGGELHNIRSLPTYWGPRDPNYPSTLTDVSYRPEPLWRRMMQRHYSVEEPKMPRKRTQRRAEPIPSMDPVPFRETRPTPVKTDYGLPAPMRLDCWVDKDNQAIPTNELVATTLLFWNGYRQKRTTHLPEVGSRKSLDILDWCLIFMERMDFTVNQMNLLLEFMFTTEIIPYSEFLRFVDLIDSYYVMRYNRIY